MCRTTIDPQIFMTDLSALSPSQLCVSAEEGITSVGALAKRIVSPADYKTLWHDRCDAMYNERYYKVLQQKDEVIFFTREQTELLLNYERYAVNRVGGAE